MSGGVDSSVSAALLKEQGCEVVGVFIKVWQPSGEKFASACTWREDRRDAMRVAAELEIPLITLDLEKEYKQSVVDYLVNEYKLGRTPNPDVMCNREIKFGAFYKWAMEHGADFVATGHYAQIGLTPTLSKGEGGNSNPLPFGEGAGGGAELGFRTADKKFYRVLQEQALEMRRKPTLAEKKIWEKLRKDSNGFHFRRQHIIDKFIVDFVCLEKSLIIEIDGDVHDYQIERDQERTNRLEVLGFKIIRFKNEEVLSDIDTVLMKIKEALEEASPQPPPKERGGIQTPSLLGRGQGEGLNLAKLRISKDSAKDQTYFLWTLTPEILTHTLFPIGGYEKSEVRKLAKKFNLPTAEKKDSQGLCFVGKIDFKDFLKEFINEVPGDVINEKGEKIGAHDGAMFYTLGERHGFTITAKTPDDKPYYIVAKDVDKNTLTVSEKINLTKPAKQIKLININWTGEAPTENKKLMVQIRYHGELYPCTLDGSTVTFLIESPLVAPGQSCVLYDNDVCLGGGVIA